MQKNPFTWYYCVLIALAKKLLTLILKFIQISNSETIKNCLQTGSFTKIDNKTM